MQIALSQHVRKQTADSRYTFHVRDDFEAVLEMAHANVNNPDNVRDGYRLGVLLVDLPPDDFRIKHRTLQEGDSLYGGFDPRTPGEEPRIWFRSFTPDGGQRAYIPKRVEAVLYHKDVLAENDERSTDAEWELITFLGYPTDDPEPMPPGTMMYNHFELPGGTATGWSAEEFVEKLRESFTYWRNKA